MSEPLSKVLAALPKWFHLDDKSMLAFAYEQVDLRLSGGDESEATELAESMRVIVHSTASRCSADWLGPRHIEKVVETLQENLRSDD